MIIKEISGAQAEEVLCHPEIYAVISDDGSPDIDNVSLDGDSQYIGGFVEGELIAVMIYHKFRDGLQCHIQVLPSKRKDNALSFAEKGLKLKEGVTIYADIPELYPNVLRFAESLKFKIIEIIENAGVKNGKNYNSKLLRLENGLFKR